MSELIKNRYKLLSIISEGTISTVWLAVDKKANKKNKNKNVIVKMLNKSYMTDDIDNIIRFKRELTILSDETLEQTARVLDKGEYKGKFFIVLEQVSGTPLNEYIKERPNISKIVELFIKILSAVDKVHEKGIIHKDLKPENILIEENENIKIIDFNFSDVIKDNRVQDIFEGTIKYASPEQIGLLKCNIDKRSDLYSLGVIFYEVLTNKMPFTGENLNELIYNQISKMPENPTKYNSRVDETLAKIVLKLLQKDPKKRYFSAKGILADLEKYKKGFRDFELGLQDEGIDITYTTSMIGRDKEVAKIANMFFDLPKNGGRFVLIKGATGLGKSRLLEEFRYRINHSSAIVVTTQDLFISDYNEYSLLGDIMLLLVREYENFPEDEKNELKKMLKTRVGEYAGLLVNINPIIEKVLGKCATVTDLDEDEMSKKEYEMFEIFLDCIATIKKSLVIFADRIELIDDDSKGFLSYMVKNINKHRIMILATTKNEKYEIEENEFSEEITLNPLSQNDISELVSEVLICDSEKIENITEAINKKSRGNPQYALQILKQMVSQNIIIRKDGEWIYNEEKVNDENLVNSFLNIQLREILDLNDEELYILTVLACVGKATSMETLSKILNRPEEQIEPHIKKIYNLKIIEKKDDKWVFANEKIRQALTERVKDRNEKVLHQRIGDCLEKKHRDDKEYILNIYEHFKKAENKMKMEEYASKIKDQDMYNLNSKLALQCFYDILNIRNDLEYKNMVAKIHYMLGEFDISANIYEDIYRNISNTEQKLEVIINLINIYNKKQEYAICEEYIKTALEMLNVKITKSKIKMYFQYLNESTTIAERRKDSKNIIALKIELFITLAKYYKDKDIVKSKFFAQRQYNLMKQLRESKGVKIDAINAFHEYCRNNSTKLLDNTLAEENEFFYKYQIAYTYKLYGEYYERKGNYKLAIEKYTQSANLYKSINNDFWYYKIQGKIFNNDYRLSMYKDAMAVNKNYSHFVEDNYKDYNIRAYSNFLKLYVAYNDSKNMEEYKQKIQDFIRENENIETSMYIDALKILGILELEYGTIESAVDYFKNIMLLNCDDTSIYLYLAEAYINQLFSKEKAIMDDKNIIIIEVKKLIRKARRKCNKSQKARCYYQKARLYTFMENMDMANIYYNMSIRTLNRIDDKYTLGRVYLDYSKALKQNGDLEMASDYMEKAYVIFAEIGANKYTKKIQKDFGENVEKEKELSTLARKMKYATQLEIILKLNQYISSILDINELLDKVLELSIRYTGAEGGYIFIRNKDTNYLEKRVSRVGENDAYSRNILHMVQKTGESIITVDATEDDRFIDNRSIIINNLKSVIAVPIKYRGQIKGVCYLSNTLSSGIFNQKDVDLLQSIMIQTAISLENAELYMAAVTDGLTGLITHKHFKYILGTELERCRRHDRTLAIGMLDIDHFKKFNDTYGHQAGDYVLAEVASIMKNLFRVSDCVARYGGEEFIVILPETDIEGGYAVCERLRQTIEETEFMFGKDNFKVTVSMGVSEYLRNGKTIDEVIKAADMALYQSKENGRNRVTIAEKIKNK